MGRMALYPTETTFLGGWGNSIMKVEEMQLWPLRVRFSRYRFPATDLNSKANLVGIQ
jgi:hypothetical protein